MMGHVGQPGGADHVADGVDARHAGHIAVLGVGLDVVLDDLQLEVVGDESLDIAENADGHEHHVGLDRDLSLGRLELGLDPRGGLVELGRLGAGVESSARAWSGSSATRRKLRRLHRAGSGPAARRR